VDSELAATGHNPPEPLDRWRLCRDTVATLEKHEIIPRSPPRSPRRQFAAPANCWCAGMNQAGYGASIRQTNQAIPMSHAKEAIGHVRRPPATTAANITRRTSFPSQRGDGAGVKLSKLLLLLVSEQGKPTTTAPSSVWCWRKWMRPSARLGTTRTMWTPSARSSSGSPSARVRPR